MTQWDGGLIMFPFKVQQPLHPLMAISHPPHSCRPGFQTAASTQGTLGTADVGSTDSPVCGCHPSTGSSVDQRLLTTSLSILTHPFLWSLQLGGVPAVTGNSEGRGRSESPFAGIKAVDFGYLIPTQVCDARGMTYHYHIKSV